MTAPAPDPSPFADYHGARRRRAGVTLVGWMLVAAAGVVGMVFVGQSSPSAAVAAIPHLSGDATGPAPAPAPATSPAPAPLAAPAPGAPPTPAPGATRPEFRIAVTATGYQTELDACQWVRMDLLDTVPFVGAHTRCGGSIVLEMQNGDLVTLLGQGLDGRYEVVDSRDAHAGDQAATATSGMSGTVILQTCYRGSGGRERLVGLAPVDARRG